MSKHPVPDTAARRLFLRQASALGLIGGAGAPLLLGLTAASHSAAQTASDYRALVCVFLFGGNDAYNTVLATDTPSWAAYTATRNQAPESIALLAPGTAPNNGAALTTPARLGGVLPIVPIDPQGRTYAMHPLLGSLVPLFNSDRRLAIVSNVGPLLLPTTKADYLRTGHPRPASLFSHNDQQSQWQALGPEGSTQGWGGRIADHLVAGNARAVFTAISASGNAVFLSGRTVRQYQVGTAGAIRVAATSAGRVFTSPDVAVALERIVSRSRGSHVLEADLATVGQRTIEAEALLRDTLPAADRAPFGTTPTGGSYNSANDPLLRYLNPINDQMTSNPLAQQLQVVARLIEAGIRGATGVRRQVFFVSLNGFDTHDTQNRNHTNLMARLAHGLSYFDTVLGGLGARGSVTTFTASDFGRTFTSNGDGTDHGWGSHHFVMGGAVRGGNLYGRFPVLSTKNSNNNNFDGSPDQINNGSLLPALSVDQYGATLARWMGLSDSQIVEVFPSLTNWSTGQRNLGFLAS